MDVCPFVCFRFFRFFFPLARGCYVLQKRFWFSRRTTGQYSSRTFVLFTLFCCLRVFHCALLRVVPLKKKGDTLFFFMFCCVHLSALRLYLTGVHSLFLKNSNSFFSFLPFSLQGGGAVAFFTPLVHCTFFFLDKTCHLALSCMSPSFFFSFCAF